jgi:hypothetical protein
MSVSEGFDRGGGKKLSCTLSSLHDDVFWNLDFQRLPPEGTLQSLDAAVFLRCHRARASPPKRGLGLLNSVNHVAVCIVEGEVCREDVRSRSTDAALPRPEIDHHAIEIQSDLKIRDSFGIETLCHIILCAVDLEEHSRR